MDDVQRGQWLVAAQTACEIALFLPGRRRWRGPAVVRALATGLVAGGLVFGVSGVAALGRQIRAHPLPAADAVLRTGGLYRVVRHPVYVGLLSAAAGVAALRGRASGVAAVTGMLVILSSKATYEERALTERFGEAYERYCGVVPRGMPPTPWIGGSEQVTAGPANG